MYDRKSDKLKKGDLVEFKFGSSKVRKGKAIRADEHDGEIVLIQDLTEGEQNLGKIFMHFTAIEKVRQTK